VQDTPRHQKKSSKAKKQSSWNLSSKMRLKFAEDFEFDLVSDHAARVTKSYSSPAIAVCAPKRCSVDTAIPAEKNDIYARICLAPSLNRAESRQRRRNPGGFPRGRQYRTPLFPISKLKGAVAMARVGQEKVISRLHLAVIFIFS
jgi:hypothetical protein